MAELSQLNEFIKKLSQDAEFKAAAEKIKKTCGTTGKTKAEFAEKLSELAKTVGLTVDAGDLEKIISGSEMVPIDENELDNTAGGCGSSCTYCTHWCDFI